MVGVIWGKMEKEVWKIKGFWYRGLFVMEGEGGDFDRTQVFSLWSTKIASPRF